MKTLKMTTVEPIPSKAKVILRFWKGVVVEPGACWLWRFSTDRYGYGQMKVDGRQRSAHRVSWEVHFGEIPRGAWVLHRCDTPRCVNPNHLFLGDATMNARDRQAKGRSNFQKEPSLIREGINHHAAKLTPELVRELRAARATGASYRVLGARFGLSAPAARDACLGLTWKNSGSPVDHGGF